MDKTESLNNDHDDDFEYVNEVNGQTLPPVEVHSTSTKTAEAESLDNEMLLKKLLDQHFVDVEQQSALKQKEIDRLNRELEEQKQENHELKQSNEQLCSKLMEWYKQPMQLPVNKISVEPKKVCVPDGLYALYVLNHEGVKESVDMFSFMGGYGCIVSAKEKGIVPCFVQINKQSMNDNGMEVFSLQLPVIGKYLKKNDSNYGSSLLFTADDAQNFEFFKPENIEHQDEGGNCLKNRSFEVVIRPAIQIPAVGNTQCLPLFEHMADVGNYKPQQSTALNSNQKVSIEMAFVLEPSANVLSELKTYVPDGKNCFIQKAGTCHHLIVRDEDSLIFYGSASNKFCPVWNDCEGTFCLFMPEQNRWIGTNVSAKIFLTEKDEEKAKFWVYRLGKQDCSVELYYGGGMNKESNWLWPYELQEYGLGTSYEPLMLQFHQCK